MDMVHLPSFLQSHVVVGRNCVNHLPIDLVMPGQCQTLFDDCPGVFGSVGTVEMFVTGRIACSICFFNGSFIFGSVLNGNQLAVLEIKIVVPAIYPLFVDGSGDDCPVIAEGFSPGQGAHFPAHAERYLAFGDQGAELLSVFADTFRPESRFFLLPDFFPGFLFDSALLLTELKLPLVVKIAAFRDEIDRRVIFVSDFRGQRQQSFRRLRWSADKREPGPVCFPVR